MRFYWEKYHPVLVSLVVTFAIFYWDEYIVNRERLIERLTSNIITVSATLLGFLLTILTIIDNIGSRRMKFIKDAGKFSALMRYLKQSIFANIAVVVACLFYVIVDREKLSSVTTFCADITFVFLTSLTILLTFRFTYIFSLLISDPESGKNSK